MRVAASVRASPYGAIAAGLATVDGALHGSASREAHRFLEECSADGPAVVVARSRDGRRRAPGFGHPIYRGLDPRFASLLAAVRHLDTTGERMAIVDDAIAAVGQAMPQQPNIDLALGALTWVANLDTDVPIFAVARIAGWAAHYAEELDERPVRYRGLARNP